MQLVLCAWVALISPQRRRAGNEGGGGEKKRNYDGMCVRACVCVRALTVRRVDLSRYTTCVPLLFFPVTLLLVFYLAFNNKKKVPCGLAGKHAHTQTRKTTTVKTTDCKTDSPKEVLVVKFRIDEHGRLFQVLLFFCSFPDMLCARLCVLLFLSRMRKHATFDTHTHTGTRTQNSGKSFRSYLS